MKFAHLADCHLGGWRDEAMRALSKKAFTSAIDIIVQEQVDFTVICGDLFNTALPSYDSLRCAVRGFNTLKNAGIPIYLIAGSHDYAASGNTMLDILEQVGLFVNVSRGSVVEGRLQLIHTKDEKTGALLTGLPGKRGGLDKELYQVLDQNKKDQHNTFSLFLFHCAIDELKTEDHQKIISQPLSLLPTGYQYYAGGHVHKRMDKTVDTHGRIVYPGPLFPNSFKELEESTGGFYIYDAGELHFKPFAGVMTHSLIVDCDNKTAEDVKKQLLSAIEQKDFTNTVILLRLAGQIREGSINDIGLQEIIKQMYDQHAYHVLKNTSKLHTPEFQEVKVHGDNVEAIEDHVIAEHKDQLVYKDKHEQFVKQVMQQFMLEKADGETNTDFSHRIIHTGEALFDQ